MKVINLDSIIKKMKVLQKSLEDALVSLKTTSIKDVKVFHNLYKQYISIFVDVTNSILYLNLPECTKYIRENVTAEFIKDAYEIKHSPDVGDNVGALEYIIRIDTILHFLSKIYRREVVYLFEAGREYERGIGIYGKLYDIYIERKIVTGDVVEEVIASEVPESHLSTVLSIYESLYSGEGVRVGYRRR